MQNYFDLLNEFNDIFSTPSKAKGYKVVDTESAYELSLGVCGFPKKQIEIDFLDNHLIVSAKGGILEETFDKKFLIKNSHKLDLENISAELTLGVLKVTLPKKAEKKTKIKIK